MEIERTLEQRLDATICRQTAKIVGLCALLEAVVGLDLEHLEEATPKGYERFNEVFEDRVQVTAWGAWRRDVRAALANT